MSLVKWLKSVPSPKHKPLYVISRETGELFEEKVFGEKALRFLYSSTGFLKWIAAPFRFFTGRLSIFSKLYGYWQKRAESKKSILPFVELYEINAEEFADPIESFPSFDAFFVRKLKKEARPLAKEENIAIIPADGRYLVYNDISHDLNVEIKGQILSIKNLVGNDDLAKKFQGGSLVLARLCPSDYHRFHFPCSGKAHSPVLINGWRYSVNPWALAYNLSILSQNKRIRCFYETDLFGSLLYIAIGATSVATIHTTYTPCVPLSKGEEMGYFSFGASSLALLFQPNRISFSEELILGTQKGYETRCLWGQPLGKAK